MNYIETLTSSLPDPESAEHFLRQLAREHPNYRRRLEANAPLASDILTLAAFSPLIAATLLQSPENIDYLARERVQISVRSVEQLNESLARYALTHSQMPINAVYANFRRRELMRIFLTDIRRLCTVTEITEGISNLADSILQTALRLAEQELDNRYGLPQFVDNAGRVRRAEVSIVSLGKLGSRELNYSSDIDLMFLYSNDGETAPSGTSAPITNREYFSKLAQRIVGFIGSPSGETAAYRVDLRLRPHGRIGALAASLHEAVKYYKRDAAQWERQVLIRSRASAGSSAVFSTFFDGVAKSVFNVNADSSEVFKNVMQTKGAIDLQTSRRTGGFDVKLGRGGIREIEFIAQGLQLAHAGQDAWLRTSHTLRSIARLAERGRLRQNEMTALSNAYEFFRRLEHLLQMENGLQTHTLPAENKKRLLVARRAGFKAIEQFDTAVSKNAQMVRDIFERIFSRGSSREAEAASHTRESPDEIPTLPDESQNPAALKDPRGSAILEKALSESPRLAELAAANPALKEALAAGQAAAETDYFSVLKAASETSSDFGERIAELRRIWANCRFQIMALDAAGEIDTDRAKRRQTQLAEASIDIALKLAVDETERRYTAEAGQIKFAVLALGKLASGGLDYDSDLDVIMVRPDGEGAELYERAVELFVNVMSGVTREGSLYRIDLRLRPHGKNGRNVIAESAFLEYIGNQAAIWELLALVKLRGCGGSENFCRAAERRAADAVFRRAAHINCEELKAETMRIRSRLEQERAGPPSRSNIDIKFGEGGMLDIYFAVRYLQLRHRIPDQNGARSTGDALGLLQQAGVLAPDACAALMAGYDFFSRLDHALRLIAGRRTKLPISDQKTMRNLARRMSLAETDVLLNELAMRRLAVRAAFDKVMSA